MNYFTTAFWTKTYQRLNESYDMFTHPYVSGCGLLGGKSSLKEAHLQYTSSQSSFQEIQHVTPVVSLVLVGFMLYCIRPYDRDSKIFVVSSVQSSVRCRPLSLIQRCISQVQVMSEELKLSQYLC